MDERHESRAIRALGGRFNTTKLYHALNLDNNYKTTIYMIDSAIMKLSKLTKIGPVYCCLSNEVELNQKFWATDDLGVCGGVEVPFISATRDHETVVRSALRNKRYRPPDIMAKKGIGLESSASSFNAVMLEIQMKMEDHGAELSAISQFPAENEIVFSPLTALEVVGYRVSELEQHGAVLVVEVLPVVNPLVMTYEGIIGKRKELLERVLEGMVFDLEREFAKKADVPLPLEVVVSGSAREELNGTYQLSQEEYERATPPVDAYTSSSSCSSQEDGPISIDIFDLRSDIK